MIYLSAIVTFCRLLLTFANSLDPDPDLDPNRMTLIAFLKEKRCEKDIFFKKKVSDMEEIPNMQSCMLTVGTCTVSTLS